MSFHKQFVRVESLAISRAFELAKEAGCGELYLAQSRLVREQGVANSDARFGKELFDQNGQFVCSQRLTPEYMHLGGEIEAFAFPAESDDGWNPPEPDNSVAFLERQYHIAFNGPKNHQEMLWVSLVFVKKTKDSDWTLCSEVVIKAKKPGVFFPTTDTMIERKYPVSA